MMIMRQTLTNGIEWRERAGGGDVLVCLHGIGSTASTFDGLIGYLPADLRVICWNAPGYGESAPLAADWPLAADYAMALLSLCEALELKRVHILGHSLGTLMGAAFAAGHPERVASLTLAACAQGRATPRGGTLSEKDAQRLDDLERDGAEAFAAARAPRLIHAPERNPDLVAAVRQDMAKVTMPGYGQAVRMLASGDLAADCRRVRSRTSVIVGTGDVVTPPDQSRAAFDALDEAVRGDYALVPHAGHAIHRQAPAALAATIVSTMRSALPLAGTIQLGDVR
ncbi:MULTISPECIES: alpha/beta fold hydrolase [Chelativorans]|jgi:pimeloyl-ACP methyl ester carboxylesterase|uniref:Alpha/beta hydrolase fold protein n=1 Tax=Chelativorans sp. (strain BNC1) TaxID=266779 RepID=Q11K55_CHESB|nr:MULTISPECIES: alpha/beta hydrolase [Chelativorans]